MADHDVIVVGAGHNALICAGYLAQAGYRVLVVERRPVVGGAVVTEEHVPGFKFDIGGSAHILIHHTPVVRDLGLERYGLHYIDCDPLFYAPFPDGTSLTIWRDLDRTCDELARVSPSASREYRAFVNKWRPVAEAMVESFLHAPTPLNLARHLAVGSGPRMVTQLPDILRSYGGVITKSFTDSRLRALVGWMAAQSGPPPDAACSAPFAIWHPMYHVSGVKRPRGGSGMLTQALARMIEDHGGTVLTDAPVKRIVVRRGRVAGVETTDGRSFSSRVVVSGAHIHTTLRMLGEEQLNGAARRILRRSRIGNGFAMVVRHAMKELPDYIATPSRGDAPGPQHRAMQFICPDMAYLERAYADYQAGRPARDPALISMTFSAVDPTLAPPGKHVMFLWGQYYPYELADGGNWDDIAEREADRMLDKLAEYAPNVKDAVIDRLIETPLYLERTLGLLRGNVMHLEMDVDQMFLNRPGFGMSRYRGPVPGLYLTGASTHPGGGIMGAAGRNAAVALLHDLSKTHPRPARSRSYAP
ncbi:MAG TPA: NAD(P)/FAD-dependent oxidoreductase [Kiritimatiellia bacterium]|nr:NAD(P)/FAD-dependent oxidoreductase [Kiritimatiellia bacterium]